ncbi:hypothetical protein CEXT_194941 [Caerostris extrusa]|uniref:Uncharacterized protein n=1 Tax=Caerostris extrusa TaxID=172846 RepID=A0AAV4M7Z2_CAEEX|nr:hypothetical protein CEXT_194941 [Caerostris extrusa]
MKELHDQFRASLNCEDGSPPHLTPSFEISSQKASEKGEERRLKDLTPSKRLGDHRLLASLNCEDGSPPTFNPVVRNLQPKGLEKGGERRLKDLTPSKRLGDHRLLLTETPKRAFCLN